MKEQTGVAFLHLRCFLLLRDTHDLSTNCKPFEGYKMVCRVERKKKESEKIIIM